MIETELISILVHCRRSGLQIYGNDSKSLFRLFYDYSRNSSMQAKRSPTNMFHLAYSGNSGLHLWIWSDFKSDCVSLCTCVCGKQGFRRLSPTLPPNTTFIHSNSSYNSTDHIALITSKPFSDSHSHYIHLFGDYIVIMQNILFNQQKAPCQAKKNRNYAPKERKKDRERWRNALIEEKTSSQWTIVRTFRFTISIQFSRGIFVAIGVESTLKEKKIVDISAFLKKEV